MSETQPKNTTRSSRKGSSTTASDDEDRAMEHTTPRGEAARKQPKGLEEERDDDLTPASENKLEGMMLALQHSMVYLTDGMASIQEQVDKLEEKSVPLSQKELRTPSRKDRRKSVVEDLIQSSRKLQWADVLGKGDAKDEDEDLDEESFPANISSSRRASESRESIETSRAPRGKLFQDMRDNHDIPKRTVQVTRVEKDCPVKITNFRLGSVAKAMRDILDFQEEEETTVRMTKVLSKGMKAHLLAKYDITGATLQSMKIDELFHIIARETQVYSTTSFYQALQEALGQSRVMDWNQVTPVNHETFYFQQLKLISDFGRVLKIMLVKNRDYCPRIDFKEFGLIRLFKEINDKTYVKYCCADLTKTSYKTMDDFFDEYTEIAMGHYQLSLATRELPYAGNKVQEEKQKEYFQRRRELSSGNHFAKKENPRESNPHKLSHISADQETESDTQVWKDAFPVFESIDYIEGQDSSDSVSINSNDEHATPESRDPYDLVQQELHAFGDTTDRPPVDKKNFACLKKLLSGKCESTSCPYGHKPDVLDKGAREIRDKIDIHLASSSKSPEKPAYTVLQRDKFR